MKGKLIQSVCSRCSSLNQFKILFVSEEAGKEKKRRKKSRKGRLATIFSATVACLPASHPGGQPVHHDAGQPARKQANRPISFSGATGTGPSNATKQRASVLHHFPSERPSGLLSPGTASPQHTEASSTAASSLLSVTALCHCTHIVLALYPGGGLCVNKGGST